MADSQTKRQWTAAWEVLEEERRKTPIEQLHDRLKIVSSPYVPPGQAFLISPRRTLPNGELEPEEDWLMRCASIRGLCSGVTT